MFSTTPPGSKIFTSDTPFSFQRGGSLPGIQLAYETFGQANAQQSNIVLLFTGLSPSAHVTANSLDPAPGWWEPVVGIGRPIDTNHWRVICVNSLGSCKGSTGPASINPRSGEPWRLDFPEITIEDIANSTDLLLQHLGIEKVAVVVGPSMGGMTALAWLKQNPGRAKHLLSISSAAAAEPYAIAIRSLQRETICNDPGWQGGKYTEDSWPENGMRMARKIGMVSYRSSAEWRERFGRDDQVRYPQTDWGMNYAIESYLQASAERFIGQFDPASYINLSRAMDWFDITGDASKLCHSKALPDSAQVAQALEPVNLASACVIGVQSDLLFPLHQQKQLADALQITGVKVEFHQPASLQGHDSFLVDHDRFNPIIGQYFSGLDC